MPSYNPAVILHQISRLSSQVLLSVFTLKVFTEHLRVWYSLHLEPKKKLKNMFAFKLRMKTKR